ncbi:MAG: hypothetical protein D6721_04750, partial [Gammaproteobacteria bacterium]
EVHLGGYASVRFRNLAGQSSRLDLRDLSLFVDRDLTPRARLFGEFELGEALVWRPGGPTTRSAEFDLERLYWEYDLAPTMRLRLGKFLTPVGYWNQVHADPLVWTVSRPLATGISFARHASGASLEVGTDVPGGALDALLFLDDSLALDPDRSELTLEGAALHPLFNSFQHGAGLHMRYESEDDRWQLGLSFASYHMRGLRERKHLAGLDLQYRTSSLELSSEFDYRASQGHHEADEWGGYVQAVRRVCRGWHLIGRYEYFRMAAPAHRVRLGILGLARRLVRHQVVKFEYRQGADNAHVAPDGWLASYAILF